MKTYPYTFPMPIPREDWDQYTDYFVPITQAIAFSETHYEYTDLDGKLHRIKDNEHSIVNE